MAEALPNGIALALQLRDPRLAQRAPCVDDPLAPLPQASSTAGSSSGAAGSLHLHVAAAAPGRAGKPRGEKRRRQGTRGAPAAQSVLPTYGARSWLRSTGRAASGMAHWRCYCQINSAAFSCISGTDMLCSKVQETVSQRARRGVTNAVELMRASAVSDEELAAAARLCQELRGAQPPASPLWAQARPQPPLPEAAVSALRRRARLDALHLGGLAPAHEPVAKLIL